MCIRDSPITLGQQALGKGDIWIDGELSSGVTEDGFSLSTKDGICLLYTSRCV